MRKEARRWGQLAVLRALMVLGNEATESGDWRLLRRTVSCARLLTGPGSSDGEAAGQAPPPGDVAGMRAELEQTKAEVDRLLCEDMEVDDGPAPASWRAEVESSTGWSMYRGEWKAKPIGIV